MAAGRENSRNIPIWLEIQHMATTDPYKRNILVVGVIMLIALSIGGFRAWDAHDNSYLMLALWIGIALAIVYLLYQIASNVEKLRTES